MILFIVINCKRLKKFNHSVKEDERKDKNEQERYKILIDFKNYMDSKDPTN